MSTCTGCERPNARQMRERIKAYDFAKVEMKLYLDTHPDEQGALELFKLYGKKREELVETYERYFGPYICTADDVCGDRWTWTDDPWPWEFSGKE